MSLKKQAISGVVWTFAQQFSVQLINFIVQIILARLLMPEMFGLIAMITVFLSIGQTLMDSGMTSSLIRTKEPDQLDYSTVFMTNMLISIVVYLIIFAGAPLVAKFYDEPLLKDILRVFTITFVIRAFVAVHVAKLTKEMDFKTQMKLQVPSTIVGAIVGIIMAYLGYGVWSLVFLNITQTIVFTVQNWIFIPWRPSFVFNKDRFKEHFSFGYKLTLSGLLDTVYNNAYRIVIGKVFNPASVGYFNQAETMRLFPVQQISTVMGKVTYPLFSNIKEDERLKKAYRQTMKLVLFAAIPVMLILILIAKEGFLFLFGAKWLPAVPYFQILAIASIVKPVGTYNLNILKVKGRSDLILKLQVIKKTVGIMAIVIALPFGIIPLIWSLTVVSYFSLFLNMWYCGKLINYLMSEQLRDIAILFLVGVLVFGVCYILRLYLLPVMESSFLLMVIIALVYSLLYLIAVGIFENKMIEIIRNLTRK